MCSPLSWPAFCRFFDSILLHPLPLFRPFHQHPPPWCLAQFPFFFWSGCSRAALNWILKGQRSLWAMVWATWTWVLLWRSQIALQLIVSNRSDFRKTINQEEMKKGFHFQSFTVMYVIIKSFPAGVSLSSRAPIQPGFLSSQEATGNPGERVPYLVGQKTRLDCGLEDRRLWPLF